MREIVTIGVGQAGCCLAAKLNETICDEHGIDPSGSFWGESDVQLEHIGVNFCEGAAGKYVPRTLLIDLEPGGLDSIRATRYGQTIRSENFIFSRSGAGNNFARGYFTEGAEMLDATMEAVRREAETAESLQGFQMTHGIGGGTGAGLGSLIVDNLREEYSDRTVSTWSIFSSTKISDVVVDPYNSVLCGSHLLETTDFSFCIDNEALNNIHRRSLQLMYPLYADLNHMISMAMAGITAGFRFPGQLNCDLRKLAVSLVPFPSLHFLMPGFAPIVSRGAQSYRPLNVPELTQEMFHLRSMFTTCDPREGVYITCGALFRGMTSTRLVEETLYQYRKKNSKHFANWLPANIKTAYCDIPPRGLKMCATFVGNTTVVNCLWGRVLDNFVDMFRRKAYLHWFTWEGLEESELARAQANIEEMIHEYQQYGSGGYIPTLPAATDLPATFEPEREKEHKERDSTDLI